MLNWIGDYRCKILCLHPREAVLAPLLCTPLSNVVTHHWSTEAGLRDGDPLLLDNLCQRQPRGDGIPDHSNPDCGCERAAHLQGSPCSERPRYRALLLGEEGSTGPWRGCCVLGPLCSRRVMVIGEIRRMMLTKWMLKGWRLPGANRGAGAVLTVRASGGLVHEIRIALEVGAVHIRIV